MGVANAGQQPFAEIFPGIPNPQSTGAPGSQQVGDQASFSRPVGGPVAVAANPFESSQGPRVMAQVTAGSTQVIGQYPEYAPLSEVSLADGAAGGPVTAGQSNAGTLGNAHVLPVPNPDNPSAESHPNALPYGRH